MNKLLFGLILILSYLPLRLLYLFSDFFYLLLITALPYRKKVIDRNLKFSFPELSQRELRILRNQYYKHFSDLLVEGIKNLTISKKELKRRLVVENPEVLDNLMNENKSILLISGHYGNWEWMITSLAFLFPFKAIGIGMPLTNSFWDKSVNKRRSRFGLQVVHSKNYKEALYDGETPKAILTLSDQSPGSSENAYWTTFLNQPTAVLFGSEFMAHEYQFIPVFFSIRKVKRGYYSVKFIPFEKPLNQLNYGELTEWHTHLLEGEIKQNPSCWLWSHKRWKRQMPDDINQLKSDQKKRFDDRFRFKK
jgi:KDO2-lipid IV(A) lauroyltransferase